MIRTQQVACPPLAAVILGIEVGQIGAHCPVGAGARHDITGEATEERRLECMDQLDQARRVEVTIEQHEHAGLDRAQTRQGLPVVHWEDRGERGHLHDEWSAHSSK